MKDVLERSSGSCRGPTKDGDRMKCPPAGSTDSAADPDRETTVASMSQDYAEDILPSPFECEEEHLVIVN